MSTYSAVPQCFVDIYPFEGGKYSIEGGQILQCSVDKNIRSGDPGRFSIVLAPGGPFGTNAAPSWINFITPTSLCIVGMARGSRRNIVMVGVVRKVNEPEMWQPGGVQRATYISGEDFTFYFNTPSYLALTVLASPIAGALAAGATGNDQDGIAFLGTSILQGTPAHVATSWYTQIMGGSTGMFSSTVFPYQNNSVSFGDAVGYFFEESPFYIPFGQAFIAGDGTWFSKFRDILPAPWYEFFVTTAPSGAFAGTEGFQFKMPALGDNVSASPMIVGRLNPVPHLNTTPQGSGFTFTDMDTSAWEALTLFTPDTGSVESNIEFSDDEVRNLYVLNPTTMRSLLGDTNGSWKTSIFSNNAAIDIASIHRYGYRPEYSEFQWLWDPSGNVASNDQSDFTQLIPYLMARLCSWFEPTPQMARGYVQSPLRPDILPACRYKYQPFKGDSQQWQFYIEGVSHRYQFGGRSSTTLTLSRGLPDRVYSDTGTDGNLALLHQGGLQRYEGDYIPGVPKGLGPTLQSFDVGNAATQALIAQVAPILNTPQGKG